jgi:hypothetical protein
MLAVSLEWKCRERGDLAPLDTETNFRTRRSIPGREVSAIATPQIEAVIDRLAVDKAFRVKYCQDPDEALGAYHLSSEEIKAIKTGDDRLLELIDGNKWEELIKALCGPHPGP